MPTLHSSSYISAGARAHIRDYSKKKKNREREREGEIRALLLIHKARLIGAGIHG